MSEHKLDLSSEQINLLPTVVKHNSKSAAQENHYLKKQNQVLRRELQSISMRLDEQLRIREGHKAKRLAKPVEKTETSCQMQLKNAYKKCQIYKREASFYRKKLQLSSEAKLQDYQNKHSSLEKENQALKEEIKQLRKINKLQEQGLEEMEKGGYAKMKQQQEKMQEEIRKLKKQADQYRREKFSTGGHRRTETQLNSKANNFNEEVQRSSRMKTEVSNIKGQVNQMLQEKLANDYVRIKGLAADRNKLRQMVDNLKMQLSEKEKQNANLRDKIALLRKNNQMLQEQLLSRKSKQKDTFPESEEETRKKDNKMKRAWKGPDSDSIQSRVQPSKYPRKQEKGEEGLMKWTHQQFNSKIKELHVLISESCIKDVYAKYEQGSPKRYDQAKGVYSILVCGQGQYIKYMEGAFKDGCLQWLRATTNMKRTHQYGNLSQSSEPFQFSIGEDEYPGALFGQNSPEGINKLGCFIHKLK